jgi:cyclase
MKKNRLIPVLLLRDGWIVQSKGFSRYQNLGNPTIAVKRLSEWAADELIYLDISKESNYDLRRDDLKHPNRHSFLEIIDDVSRYTFMPITVGGKIRTLSDIEIRLKKGADKISVNTKPLEDKSFISKASKEFGAQCIVVSIDIKIINDKYVVMKKGGKEATEYEAIEWAKIAEDMGAGEILLNSVDRDGKRNGYDIKLLNNVANSVKIPVIALGGVGKWEHFEEALDNTKIDAIAAANIFHYIDQSVYLAKNHLFNKGYNFRKPFIISINRI